MQIFDWFEGIVLRVKNRRTRKRVLTNLGLFAATVGAGSALLVYGSSYIKSRAEVDAKSLTPPSVRIEYHVFTGPLSIYSVTKKGMAYSEVKGFEIGAKWLKNDVLLAAESLLDKLELGPIDQNALPNSVLVARATDKTGKSLHEEAHYSYDTSESSWKERLQKVFKPNPAKKFFGLPTTTKEMPSNVDMKAMLQLAVTYPGLRILVDKKDFPEHTGGPIEFGAYTVAGFAPPALLSSHLRGAWNKLIRDRNPQFSDIAKYYAYFLHTSAVASIEYREIRMMALSIENIGDQPIYSPELGYRQMAGKIDGILRTEKDQIERLSRAKATAQSLPIDALKPGEKIYVPISLFMEFASEREADRANWRVFPENTADFELLLNISPEGKPVVETITVDVTDLKRRSVVPNVQNQKYYFGPSIDVDTLAVGRPDRTEIRVRKYDPLNLLIQDGDEKGSCPVLFAGAGETAKRIRPILINAVSQAQSSIDKVQLPKGASSFEIRETEPERSFIYDAKLVVELDDSQAIVYDPIHPIVQPNGAAHVLDHGQKLTLEFLTHHDLAKELSRRLEVRGYYVPYSLMSSR